MADNQNQIYFNEGNTYDVTMSFDECKSGTRDNGQSWYRYAVKYEGKDSYFFANDYNLHNKLKTYKKGDIVTIEPKYNAGEKYPHEWIVTSKGSDGSSSENNTNNDIQVKINVWAGMKVATHFSKDIDALDVNTQLVLELHKKLCDELTEKKNNDGLPF